MKAHLITIIIALLTGYIAGYMGGYMGSVSSLDKSSKSYTSSNSSKSRQNPFQLSTETEDLEYQVEALQYKTEKLQKQLSSLIDKQQNLQINDQQSSETPTKSRVKSHSSPNKKNLIASGITPDVAEDILRRMSQQDFRRLELQNLIQRSDSNARREYSKELRELNSNKISLRSEMGEDAYDQYLFVSGQNNRVKVSSVMAGSPAEASGFQSDDVILYYDNQKILSWPDIRAATIEGEIGSYTNVEILRDGQQMSLMVPRGTLGVQLDALQINPEQ
ncbi:MAG: PDZ domain-containing protein [Gammaproteobacteria bacterium]|nr:PDZ domain-containing protein [Gammaproteobacteria bacterium]